MQKLGNQNLDLSFPEIFFKSLRWGQGSRYVKCFCYSRIRNLPKPPTYADSVFVWNSSNLPKNNMKARWFWDRLTMSLALRRKHLSMVHTLTFRTGHDGRDSRGLRSKQVTLGRGRPIVRFDQKLKKNGSQLYSTWCMFDKHCEGKQWWI